MRETRVAPELQQEIRQTQVSGLLSCVGQDGVELLGSILAFGRPHRRLGLVRQGFPSEYGVLVSSPMGFLRRTQDLGIRAPTQWTAAASYAKD